MNREQGAVIEYLEEENRVLRELICAINPKPRNRWINAPEYDTADPVAIHKELLRRISSDQRVGPRAPR